jgi:ubiquinone/menaquinone biosynthesis C-methylase UbiE
MEEIAMLNKPFHEVEHEAWSHRASFYDDLFADISTQAIAPILDSLGNQEGKRHLDIACGTGHLVAAAARRG